MSPAPAPIEIDVWAFDTLRREGTRHVVLDVREPWEIEICGFEDAIQVPLGSLPARQDEVPFDVPVIVVCHHGHRSLIAADFLQSTGHILASSLSGGVEAWATEIDPGMQRY